MGKLPDSAKRGMAKKMIDSKMGTALLDIVTQAEHQLVSSVIDLQDAADLDEEQCIEQAVPAEDRREQLRAMAIAKLEGRFPEWWVANCSGLENAEEAAEKVDVDWIDQKERWADLLRENGAEGEDDALAASYVRSRYGCSLDQFRATVVEWPDASEGEESREATEMRAAAAGGIASARSTVDAVTEKLNAEESDGE